jgi:hypothetical protein
VGGQQLPPIERPYYVDKGYFEQVQDEAVAGFSDPGNSWGQRGIFFLLATAEEPMNLLEGAVRGVENIGSDASVAGQYFAAASLADNGYDRLTYIGEGLGAGGTALMNSAGVAGMADAAVGSILTRRGVSGVTPEAVGELKSVELDKSENPSGSEITALKTPSYVIGESDGGPGVWAESNLYPRDAADAAYQQAATGAPHGVEYAVDTSLMKKSDVKYFDGYDPNTGNLIDAKNYVSWPDTSKPFSMVKVTNDMVLSDAIAGDVGVKVEFRVATQEKAALLKSIARQNNLTNTVVTYWKP